MLRTIYWFLDVVITVLVYIPRLIKSKSLAEPYKTAYVQTFLQKVAVNKVKTTGSTLKISGTENIPDEACLFVCNHQSIFDILILVAAINKPFSFLAKKEMNKVPFIYDWLLEIHGILVDRNNAKDAAKAMIDAIKLLKSGGSLAIFPEGTRGTDNVMIPFKNGSFVLAQKSGVPIVPVTIKNSCYIFEKNKRIKPAHAEIYIHEKIETKHLSKDEFALLTEKVYNIICDKLQ